MNKTKLLLISAIALVTVSCGNNATNDNGKTVNDSTTIVADEPFEITTNIRYVVMDSISKHYVLAQNISAEAQTIISNLQSRQAQMRNQLQNQAAQIQQKAQNNGYLSEASYNADLKELEKKDAQFQNQYANLEQEAATRIDKLQKELTDSVQNFIKIYNKEKKYDAILSSEAGLYFNPALDITEEVVNGLNERYKGKATTDAGTSTTTPADALKALNQENNTPSVPTIGK